MPPVPVPMQPRKPNGWLLVTFSRNGEPDDRQLVLSPERAIIVAVAMIVRRFGLYHGDRITVQSADAPMDAPPTAPAADEE